MIKKTKRQRLLEFNKFVFYKGDRKCNLYLCSRKAVWTNDKGENAYCNRHIKDIIESLFKERIKNKEQVTYDRIKGYLKKNGLQKMYEHIPAIMYKICGTSPPEISRELEAQLSKMFEEIQGPYEAHMPPGRKNFLSYGYCIFKMCQLLGKEDILEPYLPLLKSREKLYLQDKIFEKICRDLGWKFIPTI